METITLRDMATDALRYWEPRRLAYNALLALVVLGCAAVNWPAAKQTINSANFLFLFILAVLANVAYCAAYLPDLFLQYSHFRPLRARWRLVIVAVGFTFAAALTYFFALSLFSQPNSF